MVRRKVLSEEKQDAVRAQVEEDLRAADTWMARAHACLGDSRADRKHGKWVCDLLNAIDAEYERRVLEDLPHALDEAIDWEEEEEDRRRNYGVSFL